MNRIVSGPLSALVSLVNEKATVKKDLTRPYIGLEHITTGSSHINTLGNSGDYTSTSNVFAADDILFGKLRPQLRKCVQADFEGYCSTDILVLRTNEGNSSSFAAKLLQSDVVFSQAIRTEEGTRMPRTSWSAIRDCEVPLPPLPEQRKIARILFTVDDLIERTEALIAKYRAIKKGLMHDLLTRGVDASGRLRPPREEAPGLYRESAVGWVPREWGVGRVRDYVSYLRSGLSRRIVEQDIGIPVVTSGNIQTGRFDPTNLRYWYEHDPQGSNTADYILHDQDILLNFINSVEQIGKVCVFQDIGRPCIYTTNLFRVKATELSSQQFPFRLIGSHNVQREIAAITKPAINQASFTTGDFLAIRVPLVPCDEQDRIVFRLDTVDAYGEVQSRSLVKLRNLKVGLMQDLLTGRVRVNA